MLNDHNIRDSFEHFCIEYDRTVIWLQTVRHNLNSNTKIQQLEKEVIQNRTEALSVSLLKIREQIREIRYFVERLKE